MQRFRNWTSLLAATALTIILFSASVAAAEKYGADFVFEACDILELNYYNSSALNYPRLFNAGLEGVQKLLKEHGIDFSFDKIAESVDKEEAKIRFRHIFDRAKQLAEAKGGFGRHDLYFTAVSALLRSLDSSHTSFATPKEYQEFLKAINNRNIFAGIGVSFFKLEDGFIYIRRIFSGLPADKAGLQNFDRLITVDGWLVSNDLDEIRSKLKGLPDTEVTLIIERGGERKEFKIKRALITPPVFDGKIIQDGDKKFGHLVLYFFNAGAASKLRDFIYQHSEVDGWILDLRANPGGYVHELFSIAEIFLDSRATVYISKDNIIGEQKALTRHGKNLTKKPLVVLIDEYSSSSSEIISCAFKENKRGILVGVKTAGATEISSPYPLSHGAAIFVSVQAVFCPNGGAIENKGVEPNVEVKMTREDILQGRDRQLEKALEILKSQ